MRALMMTVAALIVVSMTASAQEMVQFRSRVGGGTASGAESFTIADTPSGHEVSSKIAVKRGGSETSFTLHESLDAGWAPRTYRVEMSGATGSVTATAERKGDTIALAVKAPGASPTTMKSASGLPAPNTRVARFFPRSHFWQTFTS